MLVAGVVLLHIDAASAQQKLTKASLYGLLSIYTRASNSQLFKCTFKPDPFAAMVSP